MTRLIFLILLLTSCKEEPRADSVVPLPSKIATPETPTARDFTQPKVVPPSRPDPKFDTKLQHIQEQVNWIDKRIGP